MGASDGNKDWRWLIVVSFDALDTGDDARSDGEKEQSVGREKRGKSSRKLRSLRCFRPDRFCFQDEARSVSAASLCVGGETDRVVVW